MFLFVMLVLAMLFFLGMFLWSVIWYAQADIDEELEDENFF